MKIKKIIVMSMSLILMACIFTGCSGGKPDKQETIERLKSHCGGENIEVVDGNLARSLDRDLEFTYSYKWEGTPIWPDIDINLGGKYHLETNYNNNLHKYWNNEYRRCIEKYNFADVDYGEDAEKEIFCFPNLVYVFIEQGASSEDLEKVESLLSDLREICKKESEFHDSKCAQEFAYVAYVWYIDSEAGVYQKTESIRITAKTKDEHLQLDNIKIAGADKSDPRDVPLGNGKAKIYVN